MPVVKYVKKKFDSILIVSTLAKISYGKLDVLSEDETFVLQALKRAVPDLGSKNTKEISDYLQGLDENQLLGLSNNVKGILHEIQFVEIENSDGDSISASLFTDTNHPGTDVILTNHETGETLEIQLKATDSNSYVNEWMEAHPEGEILVTEEIAEKMELETSGISNEELTTDVNSFVKKIVELDDNDSLWDYIPGLPAISIAVSSFYLFKLYRENKISWNTLKSKILKLTGMKIAKFSIIAALMMIPGVNVVVGAGLLFNLLYVSGTFVNRHVKKVIDNTTRRFVLLSQ